VKHVDTRVRGGGVVSNKQIRISTSPVILTHSKEGTATVVGKVKNREKCKQTLSKAGGRGIPVVVERVVEPGSAENASVYVRWKVVVIQAHRPRRNGSKRSQRVSDKPVSLRERKGEWLRNVEISSGRVMGKKTGAEGVGGKERVKTDCDHRFIMRKVSENAGNGGVRCRRQPENGEETSRGGGIQHSGNTRGC
jgi:hypothetical protein